MNLPVSERSAVLLREILPADVDVFFEQQLDERARWMAAFTRPESVDRTAFSAHWTAVLAGEGTLNRAVMVDGAVAGYVASFPRGERREVSYWIGREYWGRGIATMALSQFLAIDSVRPLHGAAAADNAASIRVLEKCGFKRAAEETSFADARGAEILEVVMLLE